MTQKELLYIEDAIGHEKNIIAIISDAINTLEDDNLISFMTNELKTHQKMHKDLINLLEDNAK